MKGADMEMYDLGYERPVGSEITAPMPKTATVYPSISLNDKTCPFLKDLTIDDKVTIVLECKVTGVRASEGWDDVQNSNYFSLDIQKAGEKTKSES